MAKRIESMLVGPLSALATALLLAAAGAGSSGVLAQTTTLRAPGSTLRPASMPTSGFSNITPLAAPAAHSNTQTVPAIANPNVRVGVTTGAAKAYVLKAQVVPGAAMDATQKLATAKAALAEIEKQAKEQQDKETEAKIAQLKNTLSIGNSATLSVLSPKSPLGNAVLSIGMAYNVNFEKNQVVFNPGTLHDSFNSMGWSAANCDFKAPEDGFYMVAYSVEAAANGKAPTVTAGIRGAGAWTPGNEAQATLNKGVNIVAVVRELRKSEDVFSKISSSGGYFAFNSCEISRLK